FRSLLVGGGAWWFTREREPEFKGITLAQVAPAPDFELTKPDGSTFRLSEDRGQVTLLFFGYTNCPDVCPMKMRAFGQVAERLGDDAGRVGLVFVTVEPERDTPEQLAAYAARYSDHITALGGDLEDLERVWELYGIR